MEYQIHVNHKALKRPIELVLPEDCLIMVEELETIEGGWKKAKPVWQNFNQENQEDKKVDC